MALSFYSNLETMDHLNPDMSPFHHQQSELANALLGFFDPLDDVAHFPIDSLFDPPDDLFYAEPESNFLPSDYHPSLSDPSVLSLPPDQFPPSDEFEFYQCPKRPRSCGDLYYQSDPMFEANSYNGPIIGPSTTNFPALDFLSDFTESPMMGLWAPSLGLCGCNGTKKTSSRCLTAQSVAARERRRRISEKTQELGRLIPGGNKMNTAQMFQAAFNYVKFLQAQVGILELMGSAEEQKGPPQVEEQLQVLITSPAVQEKMCGEGQCIVPKDMIDALKEDRDIKSSPLISRDLGRFIESMG